MRGKAETSARWDRERGVAEFFGRNLSQLLKRADVQDFQELFGNLPNSGLIRGPREGSDSAAALQDGSPEKPLSQWGGDQPLYAHAAGGLSRYGNLVPVAAKCLYIFLYPFQRADLVQAPVISGDALGIFPFKIWVGKEAKGV